MRCEHKPHKKKKLIVLMQDLTPDSSGPLNILALVIVVITCLVFQVDLVSGADYELTRDNVEDPKMVDAEEVSLYQVKLGDPEAQAIKLLVEDQISGIRAEQEGTFILLWDKGKPTGAVAGVRIMNGNVDLLFINELFSHKVRGIFRRVLNAKNSQEIREILGQEDCSLRPRPYLLDRTRMGVKSLNGYKGKGFLVNFLDGKINVEFCLKCADFCHTW